MSPRDRPGRIYDSSIVQTPISFSAPVAVTGATGYVAAHVVRELLLRGATVHATAREPTNQAKVKHLTQLAEELPGTLKLFAADLLDVGSFASAIDGCEVVIHTASPFELGEAKNPQRDLIDPALNGTRNVLSTCSSSRTVRRVVLTSSTYAIYGDPSDCVARGRPLNEDDWNETSSISHGAYALSKTLAEREAWAIEAAQTAKDEAKWRLVVVNPGFVMGPSLTSRNDSASIDFLLALIDGRRASGIWQFYAPWVDVRDVGYAHVEAALRAGAEGRHALVGANAGVWDVINGLREDFGTKVLLPRMRVPKWLAYLAGPAKGYSWTYVSRNVDVPLQIDAARSRARLGLSYRPLRETVREHVEQMMRDGLYVPR